MEFPELYSRFSLFIYFIHSVTLIAQLVKNPPAIWETPVLFLGQENPLENVVNELVCNEGGLGSTLGLGRSPGERKGYPLQYSDLDNSMNYIIHGVSKS